MRESEGLHEIIHISFKYQLKWVVWVGKTYILNMLPSSNWRSEFKFTDILCFTIFEYLHVKWKGVLFPLISIVVSFKILFSVRIYSVSTTGLWCLEFFKNYSWWRDITVFNICKMDYYWKYFQNQFIIFNMQIPHLASNIFLNI